ncbi:MULTISPECIES: GntR family transcriptional regulator [unclassified Arthrobacter]|uniref:GntR family transcriptional regulator n=1 Tax=unclassified Arthrobacter TaxID=235627 RepID=UPI0009719CFC|nr:GntR family transcriptional regulator [Arthrobacter sp. QXT-31]APX01429.1 GntR family transcriptional regulator [Arthrobacter sp. QXT-31]
MSIPPIALTKSAYAYDELRRRILTGQIKPGSVFSQTMLAQELGVSTTPLREALRRLAAEGMVQLDSHRDARVTPLTADEARNLYVIRENLDPLAAALAATSRTPDDVSSIEAALKRLTPLSDSSDLDALTAHRNFHRAIYVASHNPLLIGILEGLWDKADQYRQIGLQNQQDSSADQDRVQQEHVQIAEAVIAGQADRAREVMQRHVLGSLGRRAIDVLEGPK